VTLTFGPRMRTLLIVGVLALAAVGAGLMVLNRTQSSSDASPGATGTTATTATPAQARPAAPSATAPKRAPATTAQGDQLPAAIRSALASNHVVVVALYDPKAKIDDTAVREAGAGAQLAGTTFVPVDVTKDEVDALNARYGVIQDPAVLVLRPPGDLVVRIDGFADRDTVAQAAANAAS
jgi:Tfp pilus assembly protein PilV